MFREHGLQPACHLDEHGVARGMAIGVVHGLEEVDVEDGDRGRAGLVGVGEPGPAVRRPGEHVAVRELFGGDAELVELLGLLLEGGGVGLHHLQHLLHLLAAVDGLGDVAGHAVAQAAGDGRDGP